jgi:hypothetical protein
MSDVPLRGIPMKNTGRSIGAVEGVTTAEVIPGAPA